MMEYNENPEVKAKRLQQQRRLGLLWLCSALAIVVFMAFRRGHPKNWRMGEAWVTRWGGDWEAMQREIEWEKMQYKLYQETIEKQNRPLETATLEEEVGETVSLEADENNLCIGDECAAAESDPQ